jgi:hypothetical protein
MDPVPDPAPGIEPRTSGSAARKSDHKTTEIVLNILKMNNGLKCFSHILCDQESDTTTKDK